jgi:nucleotide-binding universal stress UspA family protein
LTTSRVKPRCGSYSSLLCQAVPGACRRDARCRDAPPGNRIALAAMNTTGPRAANLCLVVGYDGSPPASRALDASVRLLHGRPGSIEVVYVAHLPSIDMLSAGAVGEMEANFDDIARELDTLAREQLRGREERWRFQQRQGLIPGELIAAAEGIRDAHPGDTVLIVVGSSSHALHRVVGSVAVSLARRSPVPLVVVP